MRGVRWHAYRGRLQTKFPLWNRRGQGPPAPWIRYRDPGKCSSGEFENLTSRKGDFLRFSAKWGNVLPRPWPHFRFRLPFERNIGSPHAKTGPASQVVQGNCRAHLIHMVTKHKFWIETGGIHIFWTETNEKREFDKKEGLAAWGVWIERSGVWACEKSAEACDTRSRRVLVGLYLGGMTLINLLHCCACITYMVR